MRKTSAATNRTRSRWAAVGAAVAVTLGAGSLGLVNAQSTPSDGLTYIPLTPCRLADSRPAPDNVGKFNERIGANMKEFDFAGRGTSGNCTLPANAEALTMNVTGIQPTAASFYTLHPEDEALPQAAHLVLGALTVTENEVTVKLGADGQFTLYNDAGTSHVVIDVLGVFVNGACGADGADGADGDAAPMKTAWYPDSDADTYGDANTFDVVFAVDAPVGRVADRSDCDDSDGTVNPGAAEVFGDGVDNSCIDADGDGAPDSADECPDGPVIHGSPFGGVLLAGGLIERVAGLDTPGYSGDGCAAVDARIADARNLTTYKGDLYFAELANFVIRKVDRETGIISTVAGNGTAGSSGDGGPATDAQLAGPHDMAFDSTGRMYIGDNINDVIRSVDPITGFIEPVTAIGSAPSITGLALGDDDTLYFADGNTTVFEVDLSVGIPTVTALATGFNTVRDVAVLPDGNLVAADSEGHRVSHIDVSTGTVTAFAGTGSAGAGADGVAATSSALNKPYGVSVDSGGLVYIAGYIGNSVRVVDTAGVIETIAGTGANVTTGDGGLATSADVRRPIGVHVDSENNVWIAQTGIGSPPVDENFIRVIAG